MVGGVMSVRPSLSETLSDSLRLLTARLVTDLRCRCQIQAAVRQSAWRGTHAPPPLAAAARTRLPGLYPRLKLF